MLSWPMVVNTGLVLGLRNLWLGLHTACYFASHALLPHWSTTV